MGLWGSPPPAILFPSLRGVVISLCVALLEHHNAYPTNDFKDGTLRLSVAYYLQAFSHIVRNDWGIHALPQHSI